MIVVVIIIIIVNDVTFIISSIIIVIIVIINVSIIVIVTVVIVTVVIVIVSIIVSIIIIIANIIVVIIIILSKIDNIMVGIIVIIIIIMIIIHATGVSRLRLASSHHGASSDRPACQRSLFLYLSRNQIKTTGLTELTITVKFSLSCSLIASKQKKKGILASPDNTDGQAVPIY